MALLIHREKIMNIVVYCSTWKCKCSRNDGNIAVNDCEMQLLREVGIGDDEMRRNANIVDM